MSQDGQIIPKKRQAYLREVWGRNPYPEAASGRGYLRGRITEITPAGLKVFSDGRTAMLALSSPDFELAPGFIAVECLGVGDIIEAKGSSACNVFACESVRLLVPSSATSPFAHTEGAGASFDVERARRWQEFMSAVRSYFQSAGFIELRTPTLVPSPGMEPFLDPFTTTFERGRDKRKFYLPTSPEFHLKKALTLGFEKCFEFKECFRNGELSEHHQPEFMMLEWYRAYANNDAIIEDIRGLFGEFNIRDVEITTMPELWLKTLNFGLTPKTSRDELAKLAAQHNVAIDASDSADDIFNRIFLEKIEPALEKKENPVIVRLYPASQAALARLTEEGWADRFELYWRGLEIANAFHELNDAKEQRLRFADDQKKKKELGKEVVPVDEEFLESLEWGMPPSAGIALGVERLFIALLRLNDISQVRLFPLSYQK